ncbi:MAG: polysaccharide deacetylase family protein [Candidatus Paceibacterota bacterium]|jgi:peptidoglycan/xylan/chitin deacetylase (PgdA/CDA1 family)
MDTYIKKVKWYFGGIVIVVITLAVTIGLFITQSPYLKESFIVRAWKIVTYRIALTDGYSLRARATSLIGLDSPQSYTKGGYAESIPVIVYHGLPNIDDGSEVNISANTFKDQMFALKKHGYTTVTTNELFSFLRGDIALPEKSVMISFDDGRVSSFDTADPILTAADFKAVMFAITRFPQDSEGRNNYYLSMNELKQMEKSSTWDIQSHSYDGHGSTYPLSPTEKSGHFFGFKQWLIDENRLETDGEFEARIQNDLQLAKNGLEKDINKQVTGFAVPYGDYGQNETNFSGTAESVLRIAKDYYNLFFFQNAPGHRFTQNYFLDKDKGNDFFLVKRINANSLSGAELIASLERSSPKPLPFTDTFTKDSGWIVTWGDVAINNNSLQISALPNESGATVILDGTRLWKSYSVTSTVNSPAKSGVYLWLRFQDDNNNIACNFSNGFIHIEQTVNGIKKVTQGSRDTAITIPAGDFKVQGSINDRTITCTLNNERTVTDNFADKSLTTGGIGFKTWSEVRSTAKLIIKDLSVTGL